MFLKTCQGRDPQAWLHPGTAGRLHDVACEKCTGRVRLVWAGACSCSRHANTCPTQQLKPTSHRTGCGCEVLTCLQTQPDVSPQMSLSGTGFVRRKVRLHVLADRSCRLLTGRSCRLQELRPHGQRKRRLGHCFREPCASPAAFWHAIALVTDNVRPSLWLSTFKQPTSVCAVQHGVTKHLQTGSTAVQSCEKQRTRHLALTVWCSGGQCISTQGAG